MDFANDFSRQIDANQSALLQDRKIVAAGPDLETDEAIILCETFVDFSSAANEQTHVRALHSNTSISFFKTSMISS